MATGQLEYGRGESIAGKYEVIDLLDESPLGVAYRCRHGESGKNVRILLLRPEIAGPDRRDAIVDAFTRARALKHENVIRVGEIGEHRGVAYVSMEDFDGQPLRALMNQHKVDQRQFSVKEAAQIVSQILEGLRAAHGGGMVMRALRPEYVLVNVRWAGPKQKNFVATVRLVGLGFWDLVATGALAEDEFGRGEAQYLAPELKSFEPRPTPRSDIYSAGVVFYELLVGQAPVGTFQLPRTRRPDLPEHVNDVVELALANAPEDRYQAANDFVTDLQRTFQDGGDDEVRRRPIIGPIAWALALIGVLFVALIVFNLRTDPEKEAEAADSQVRAQVAEAGDHPTPEQVQAILASAPQNMLYVPAGPFVFGRFHSEKSNVAPGTEPLAEVVDVPAFLIDAFEYANLKDAEPTKNVSAEDAARMCAEAGKRLCTEHEWEKACKGPRNTVYAYGDTFSPTACGNGLEQESKSGALTECKSGWGVFDMSGNYREWTSTAPGGKDNRRVVKGGLKGNPEKGGRCALSNDASVSYRDASLSFRCCKDPG